MAQTLNTNTMLSVSIPTAAEHLLAFATAEQITKCFSVCPHSPLLHKAAFGERGTAVTGRLQLLIWYAMQAMCAAISWRITAWLTKFGTWTGQPLEARHAGLRSAHLPEQVEGTIKRRRAGQQQQARGTAPDQRSNFRERRVRRLVVGAHHVRLVRNDHLPLHHRDAVLRETSRHRQMSCNVARTTMLQHAVRGCTTQSALRNAKMSKNCLRRCDLICNKI